MFRKLMLIWSFIEIVVLAISIVTNTDFPFLHTATATYTGLALVIAFPPIAYSFARLSAEGRNVDGYSSPEDKARFIRWVKAVRRQYPFATAPTLALFLFSIAFVPLCFFGVFKLDTFPEQAIFRTCWMFFLSIAIFLNGRLFLRKKYL